MVDVLFYSAMEVLSGLAPTFTVLVVLRFLFGLGMGGEWGLGASLALEKSPPDKRGFWSGLLQQGYPVGYLLATVANVVVTGPRLAVAVRPGRDPGAHRLPHPHPGR
ncbi:MFS transporter [Actinomycetospora soli]|uniref:MFS transporter n=1 Tax=Actinomycetospora soli TaxID=2893887 RepID=UPI0027E35985|nr:MFS transporter [Actinomycetospora soli]